MIIKKGNIKDIDAIMLVYQSCIKGMIEQGIDQWDETYPNRKIILNDLKSGDYYIGLINNEIVAGIKIDTNQDPSYLTIDWLDKSNLFMVVHRLCSKTSVWNKGVGKKMMCFAENLALNNGFNSIRLDTYINNPKAIQFYTKLGYQQLGHIHLKPHKDIYYCFEKVLNKSIDFSTLQK